MFPTSCVEFQGNHGVNDIGARFRIGDKGLPQLFGHSWQEVSDTTASVHDTRWSVQQGIVKRMGDVRHGKICHGLLHGGLSCFSERSPHIVVVVWISNSSEVEHYNWLQLRQYG